MPSRNNLQDPRLSAHTKGLFSEAEAIIQACYSPTMRISQLYDAALARPGNKDPFLAWWEHITDRHTQLASEMQTAVFEFKSLEAQLDGGVSKVEEWMKQFDVAVYAMARWAFELQGALAVDQVQKFVAEEEVVEAVEALAPTRAA
ncbi:MAG: hypothetical protein ASARMPREDX12_002216 [Alectoria sarmentosa]|nr:MAG: hypothetical protein ASARMPREDX12_002216 [Alectoria sarmentosa]